jgi:hypothetical protein
MCIAVSLGLAIINCKCFWVPRFEMLHGRTPFFDRNRKLMFYRIINTEPSFPPTFSPSACDCIRGLLRVDDTKRLGSGRAGAMEIMETAFFSTMDFEALHHRDIAPPFLPDVADQFDTEYVPKAYLQTDLEDSPWETSVTGGKDNSPAFETVSYTGDMT